MAITDARRILVTTWDAEGNAEATPEWVVGLPDARIGFWTADATEWTRRLGHSPVLSVQASGRTGRVDRQQPLLEGRGELVLVGPVFEAVKAATREKYGVATSAAAILDRLKELGGGETPEGVVIIDVVG